MLTDLAVTPIADTIYRLAAERRSGDLHVGSGAVARMIFFDHGRIVFAASNLKEERLGEALVALGRISDADFEHASDLMRADRTLRFGDALIRAGVMDKKAVGTSVANQVAKIVLACFKLESGTASFDERRCTIPMDYMVSVPVKRLLLTGINGMTSAALVRAGVGDIDRKVRLARVPPFTFTVDKCTPTQKEVLEKAITPTTLRRLATGPTGVTLGRLRAVYAFVASGLLEDPTEADAPKPVVETETSGFLLSNLQRQPEAQNAPEPPAPPAPPPPVVAAAPPAPEPAAPAVPAPPAQTEPSADLERLLTQANVSLMVSDFASAVQNYAKIVELQPDVPAHRARLAVLMTRWPQTLRQAERQFLEALRLDPENAELHYQFGLYYRTMKVPSRAIAEFRTAVRLDPQHKKARAELTEASPNDAVFKTLKKFFR